MLELNSLKFKFGLVKVLLCPEDVHTSGEEHG